VSMGPDFNEVVIGSEGNFGILTEVVIKIHPAPEAKRYGSIVFPDFDTGVDCMREIAKSNCQPASLRLVDNFHFESSAMLRQSEGKVLDYIEGLKRTFLSAFKGFDLKKVAVATFLFEGKKDETVKSEMVLLKIAKSYGGFSAGEGYGKMGYQVTFYIAYIRVSVNI
jgi:alkyldihydroxyacetonephosphate synthase